MLCPKCQHRNPDENRFCGKCGCDLAKSAPTIYPREGYDEAELPPVSEVEPEVPRFRRDLPPLAQSEYGPPVDSPREGVNADMPAKVPMTTESVPPQRTDREDLRSFGNSNSILFSVDPRHESHEKEPVRDTTSYTSEEPARPQGLHGPSFLGLADGPDPDFLDDIDEPRSHARRNWFLFAVALIAVLAFAEWRNIRETGLNFAGAMKLNLPHKKGQQPSQTESAATETHSENGPANNGKPAMEVNPLNSGIAKQDSSQPGNTSTDNNGNAPPSALSNTNGQQGTGTVSSGQQGGAQEAGTAGTPQNSNGATPAADQKSAADQKPRTEQAKNNEPDSSARGDKSATKDSSDDESDSTDAAKPATPAKLATKRSPRPAEAKASPGAAELTRAESASSPETAAKWLWASTSKGNLDAPVRLADMYANGRGVSKDCEQATVLLRSSARRGNPRAAARLGMYYATGQCVQLDRSQAWHWLTLAHQKDPNSDWITQYRQRLWSQMNPDERARAGSGPTANASE